MRSFDSVLVVSAALVLAAVPAGRTAAQVACRPPARSTVTFLPAPPADAGYPVMAQVELVNLIDARAPRGASSAEAATSRVRVRVLLPIKGVARDDSFVVDTGGSVCDETVAFGRLGQKAFIAGQFVGDRRLFVGQHRPLAR